MKQKIWKEYNTNAIWGILFLNGGLPASKTWSRTEAFIYPDVADATCATPWLELLAFLNLIHVVC